MLRWYDEMSLFEPGAASFHQFLLYPGGIFRFAGTFLTQFLYYPALGAAMLILIWLLCAWLTKISFRLSESTAPLSFLVPFCLMASVLHFDEACITFESQGYVFYNSLGFTFSLAAYWLFTTFRRNAYAQCAITILLPLLYPLAGFFSLLPAALCILDLCINCRKGKKIIPIASAVISAVLIAVIPLLYYRYFNGTTVDNDYLYLKGLPELLMESFDWYLWRPFAFASAILIILAVCAPYADSIKAKTSKILMGISIVLFACGILGCIKADMKKSEQLRATVLMLKAVEQHDWNRVSHIMSLTKESANYTMCLLENLANAYNGKGARNLDNMVTDIKDLRHDEEFNINAFVGVPVNHFVGRFNQSHRWATENIVQYGNRVYFIKYIVLNAIMNRDLKLAKKFNRLLMQTMFHRQWAEEMERYIDDPSLINTLPDYEFQMLLRADEIMRGE